jgi:phosphate transport system permease protein
MANNSSNKGGSHEGAGGGSPLSAPFGAGGPGKAAVDPSAIGEAAAPLRAAAALAGGRADFAPKRRLSRFADALFAQGTNASVFIVTILIFLMVLSLFIYSLPAIKAAGWNLISGLNWDPSNDSYGAFPFLAGTLITSLLALLISLPFSLAIGILLGEYFKKGPLPAILGSAIELLAGIPSIIYGIWGFFFLIPLIQKLEFAWRITPMIGSGVFTAGILLAIMIIPYSASLAREVILLTPPDLKEAAYSLGATRFEVVRRVIVPHAFSGIVAGQILAFGRALGETMAVAIVIGNNNMIPGFRLMANGVLKGSLNLFSSGATIPSVIVNEYPETIAGDLHSSALIAIGLELLVITLAFGFIGRAMINRMAVRK